MRFFSLLPIGCVAILAMDSCAVRRGLPAGAVSVLRPALAEATTFCLVDGCFEPWHDALQPTDLYREVERQMTLRGYRPLDFGPGLQPDLLVYCSLYGGPHRFSPVPEGRPSVGSPPPPRQTLRAGSVVLQLFDTRLRHITWSGYADGLRDGEWATDEALLPRAAQQILDDYHKVAPGISASSETASVGRGVKRRLRRESRAAAGSRPPIPATTTKFLRENTRTPPEARAKGLTMTSVDKRSRNLGSPTRCRIASNQL